MKIDTCSVVILMATQGCLPTQSDDWRPPNRGHDHVVLQRTPHDCGVAAVATYIQLHGERVAYEEVSAVAKEVGRGLTMLQMANVTEVLGRPTRGYRFASPHTLPSLTDPWIALLGSARSGHYVVVHRVAADTVFVFDPKAGYRAMKSQRFRALWTRTALLPTPWPGDSADTN